MTTSLRNFLHQPNHVPTTPGHQRPAWMERAACRAVEPEIFYPAEGGAAIEALEICFTCPVVVDCLAWALATETIAGCYGVAGGTTAKERAAMLRRKRVGT